MLTKPINQLEPRKYFLPVSSIEEINLTVASRVRPILSISINEAGVVKRTHLPKSSIDIILIKITKDIKPITEVDRFAANDKKLSPLIIFLI